jgi:hypothetical protein
MIDNKVIEKDRKLVETTTLPYRGDREILFPVVPEKLRDSRMRMSGVLKQRKKHKVNLNIVGTGRCGSTWLSRTLIKAGIDAPHECVGADGTVSQFFHTDSDWYPFIPWATDHVGRKAHVGERLGDFDFAAVVHLVRHPLEVEASMRGIFNRMNYYWLQDCGILTVPYDMRPASLRNLFAWRDVVRHCSHYADVTVTLRELTGSGRDKSWKRLLEYAGFKARKMPILPAANKSSGFKKHEPMTWSEVDELDAGLGKELRKMCRELRL